MLISLAITGRHTRSMSTTVDPKLSPICRYKYLVFRRRGPNNPLNLNFNRSKHAFSRPGQQSKTLYILPQTTHIQQPTPRHQICVPPLLTLVMTFLMMMCSITAVDRTAHIQQVRPLIRDSTPSACTTITHSENRSNVPLNLNYIANYIT